MNATQIYVRTEDIQVLYRYVYILYDTAEEMSMIVK